jgi:hypothetical protein
MISNDEAESLRALLWQLIEERRSDREYLMLIEMLTARLGDEFSEAETVDSRSRTGMVSDAIGLLSTLALDSDKLTLDSVVAELSELSGTAIEDVRIEFLRTPDQISLRESLPLRSTEDAHLRDAVDRVIGIAENEFERGFGDASG